MQAPDAYVAWINQHLGFNPRGQANSDALSDFVVADLNAGCPALRRALDSGVLGFTKNASVRTHVVERSVDLAIHEKALAPRISVRVSVEHKSIMAAHGKARKNRYGDIIAYSNHVHNHRSECIAGAIVLVNTSPVYENPDAFARGLKRPPFKMHKVVADTVAIFAGIPLRDEATEANDQPEALAVVLVDYDGIHEATLVREAPAPRPGNPLHYRTFLRRLCSLYVRRFGAR